MPIVLYSVAAMFSATLAVAALHHMSLFMFDGSGSSREYAAIVLLALLLILDALRVWAGQTTSTGLNRQTPKAWGQTSALGVVGWGLDTGIPISTIRATPLPAIGMALTLCSLGSALGGLAYGIGLVAGVTWGSLRETGTVVMRKRLAAAARLGRVAWMLAPTSSVICLLGLQLVFFDQ
ncbi:MAG: hypothetical protein RL219_602 [Actinomycetota bacterium]|jgi:hypothetical protein